MKGKFGEFITAKRKERNLTLRGLASSLGIAPAYMSDIEKGNRYPPDLDKLYKLAALPCLTKEETNTMFDLAAGEKADTVSPDLTEYIMNSELARQAIRMARDHKAHDSVWVWFMAMLKNAD